MTNETYKLYNGEVELIFDPTKHLYTVNGERVTGVTGAIGAIAKPALTYWAAKCAVEHLASRWQPGVGYDEIQIQEMLDGAKIAHVQFKESAGNKGKMIHEWIEAFIKGQNPPSPINKELLKATEAFVQWTQEHKVKFILSEQKIYSKTHKYAGTLDFTAEVDGVSVIGDVKTSSGIYDEFFFQTAAYQFARKEEHPREVYDGNLIVRCGKDGSLQIAESLEYLENLTAFLGALAIYNRQQELRDRRFATLLEVK